MPAIKIKELPKKSLGEIMGNDLMVIEDGEDTKQITILSLQSFFGNDKKLEALASDYNAKFKIVNDKIAELVKQITDGDDAIKSTITNLYNDHELTKRRLGRLQEDLTDAENDIVEIFRRLKDAEDFLDTLKNFTENYEERISKNEEDIADLKNRVSVLETNDKANRTDIDNLRKDLTSLSKHVDTEVKRLDDRIDTVISSYKDYIDKVYDDMLKYIDYYHHIHTNPPNFDEPYKGDQMVSNYIYPVGTIFTTSTPDFETNKWFPGTWKYIGVGAVYNDKDERHDIYTHIRIE